MSKTPPEANLEPAAHHPEFQAALHKCDAIAQPLEISDAKARRHQRIYSFSAVTAATLGALAVLMSILSAVRPLAAPHDQALESGGGSERVLLLTEVGIAGTALVVVVIGLFGDVKGAWLRERNKAERYKLLKFGFLIDPARWADPDGRLQTEVEDIRSESPDVKNWVKLEPVPLFSAAPIEDRRLLLDLLDYYCANRLSGQLEFLEARAEAYERRLSWLRPLPVVLFYLSFLCVAVHASIDSFSGDSSARATGTFFLALAIGLPVAAAAVRTILLSRELARNSSRYAAKLHALTRLTTRLQISRDRLKHDPSSVDTGAVLQALSGCEYLLESDHREWTRLMLEAEWF